MIQIRRFSDSIKLSATLLLTLFLVLGCGAEEGDDLFGEGGEAGEGGGEAGEGGGEDQSVFDGLYADSFSPCSGCHGPDAPGATEGTEATLDFTDADTAYEKIVHGVASGLVGNFDGCNGVPFVGASPELSLLVAVMDEDVRANFNHPDYPDCIPEAISDMTIKIGGEFSDLDGLKAWIEDGAPR